MGTLGDRRKEIPGLFPLGLLAEPHVGPSARVASLLRTKQS